ncbi:spore photoproduct lyase family protein, partial [Bacillus sp. D-CC]
KFGIDKSFSALYSRSNNSRYVIKNFEPGTSPFEERIEAARKVAGAGYPLGFIVAPLYMHEGWEEGYREL